jgi:hypothetical protein
MVGEPGSSARSELGLLGGVVEVYHGTQTDQSIEKYSIR